MDMPVVIMYAKTFLLRSVRMRIFQKAGTVKCEIGWQEAISSNDSRSYLDNQCINLLEEKFLSPFLATPPPVI